MTDKLLNGANGAVPSYMQGVADDQDFGGGMDGSSFPRLAFKGNRFRLRQGEDEIVLPNNTLELIILKDYPYISRLFFAGAYSGSGDGERPACASADGEKPLSTIATPQNSICATCPQNQKGSVITDDGRKSRACGFYKRIVVTIKDYEDVGPVICDVKSMSLFGDSKPNDNLWTLKAYFARLKANNTQPFHIVTELSFDVDSSVPVVLFKPLGYVDETTFARVVTPLVNTPDGIAQLELFADTATVRIEGDDEGGGASAAQGFRDKLLEGDKPKHLDAPAKSLEEQLAAALEAADYALAGEIKAKMDAGSEPAATPAAKTPAEPTVQEVVDGLKVDLKVAIEASDYVLAGKIQEEMTEVIASGGAANPKQDPPPAQEAKPEPANDDPNVNEHGERWNPELHATSSKTNAGIKNADGHWRARRGITPTAAVDAPPAQTTPPPADVKPEDSGDSGGFSGELDDALKDFGFG